jgi:hypothetical protein
MSKIFILRLFQQFILWRIDQLVGKYLETNNQTKAVTMQRRCKHVSTVENGVFYSVRAKWFKGDNRCGTVS